VGILDKAIDVIETLEAENDDDWEVWYLFGLAYYRKAQTLLGGGSEAQEEDAHQGTMMMDQDGNLLVDDFIWDAKECLERIFQVRVLASLVANYYLV